MKNEGKFYYIEVTSMNCDMFYGYTDSKYLAVRFRESIEKNRVMSGKQIRFTEYEGTLIEFCKYIKDNFKVILCGDDIITTLDVDIPVYNKRVEFVSTCKNALGDNWRLFAMKSLMRNDMDNMTIVIAMLYSKLFIIKDDNLRENISNLLTWFLENKLCIADNDTPYDMINDIIYGIMKGWFHVV